MSKEERWANLYLSHIPHPAHAERCCAHRVPIAMRILHVLLRDRPSRADGSRLPYSSCSLIAFVTHDLVHVSNGGIPPIALHASAVRRWNPRPLVFIPHLSRLLAVQYPRISKKVVDLRIVHLMSFAFDRLGAPVLIYPDVAAIVF